MALFGSAPRGVDAENRLSRRSAAVRTSGTCSSACPHDGWSRPWHGYEQFMGRWSRRLAAAAVSRLSPRPGRRTGGRRLRHRPARPSTSSTRVTRSPRAAGRRGASSRALEQSRQRVHLGSGSGPHDDSAAAFDRRVASGSCHLCPMLRAPEVVRRVLVRGKGRRLRLGLRRRHGDVAALLAGRSSRDPRRGGAR